MEARTGSGKNFGAGDGTAEVERCLIGAALVEPALAMGVCEKRGVEADWFTLAECREVWPALARMWRESGVIDPAVLGQALGRSGAIRWLTGCMELCASSKHVGAYVERLAAERLRRAVAALGRDLMKDAAELGGQEALERAEGALASLRAAEKASYGGFRTVGERSMIQFTAPTSHGSSGGALLNLYGELIGILTAGFDDGQNLNLAVDAGTILDFARGLL